MTPTNQPKTQDELQARVLEVLRREWPLARLYDHEYELVDNSDRTDGYLVPDGDVHGAVHGFYGSELDALAEASRLLRDGVAKPSRAVQALAALRVGFNDAWVEGERISPKPGLYLSKYTWGYGSFSEGRHVLLAEHHRAIAAALDILNAPGDE